LLIKFGFELNAERLKHKAKKLSAFGFMLSAFKTAKPIFCTVYRFSLFSERKNLKLRRVLLLYFAYQLYNLQQAWILY